MNLRDKFRNRYNILMAILVIVFGILLVKLSILTIADGDKYREMADTKRIQTIPITAPRGEIRDRNGKLLAGNRTSFTVQLLKDDIKNESVEDKNMNLLKLVRFLEEDGTNYLDEFPIHLNVFKYKSESDYLVEELTPSEKAVELIRENYLIYDILNSYYVYDGYGSHYVHIVADKTLQSLRNHGTEVPIYTSLEGGELVLYFDESEDIQKWKKDNGIDLNATPIASLSHLIKDNKTAIREFVEHPLSRKIVYEILENKGLVGNLILEDFSLVYDDEYKNQKRILKNEYDFVTDDTTGEEDFLNIFKEVSLDEFLGETTTKINAFGRETEVAIGEGLIKLLRDKDRSLKFNIEIENGKVDYIYKGKKEFKDISPKEILISESERLGVLDDFLKSDEIRPLAQKKLLKDGVNTKISVADGYEYAALNEKKSLYKKNKIDSKATAEEAFNKLRENKKISEELSVYEARGILVLEDILENQGYRAYEPISIAYGIKDETVAKIEENLASVGGVQVSMEPIRYYPESETAAHVLGYLGRISQENEIEKYVKEKGYSPNDLIGKTGIEESFESYLRGEDGKKIVEVDAFGNTTKVIEEVKPIPGNNVYLSIDLDVQKKAEESIKQSLEKIQVGGTYESEWGNYKFGTNRKLGRPYRNANSGGTVALDVNTGEVLALVSYPAYDPNLFATGISSSDWESLFPENTKDQLAPKPLYNIATQTAVQPGSTFKMATALAGLEKGLSPYATIRDQGYVQIGNNRFGCWLWNSRRATHGDMNTFSALEHSCNYYYYSLAMGTAGVKVEIEDIQNITEQLGMNDKTGIEINIPAETHGGAPDPKRKSEVTKALMKRFLANNLNDFILEESKEKIGNSFTEEEIAERVEVIGEWIDEDSRITKGEALTRLKELDIDGEKKLKNEDGTLRQRDLADEIVFGYLNEAKWNIGDTLNVTIGQGEGQYTPIQMANFVATIVNGGKNNKLSLISNVKNYNDSKVVYTPEREFKKMELNDYQNLEYIKEAMHYVSSREGTARRIFQNFPVETGSKTGTAEKEGRNPDTGDLYDNFAWFVGFAPYENPEIAVATVLFQGGSGGHAGPATRDIMAEYLGLNENVEADTE